MIRPSDRPVFPGGGRYRRLNLALRQRFGARVHKVTLRGGFGCPNRDGRINHGGCVFCSEYSLQPASGPIHGPIADQLAAGFRAIARRTKARLAIAYFQEGTATDAPLAQLETLYGQALDHPQVVGLAVGTRPDCLPDEVLDLLQRLAKQKPVWLELGLQTADDDLLRTIRRGHSVADFEQAVQRAHQAGLEVTAHIILDLPGETTHTRNTTADCLNRLGTEGVKIHNLHILKYTPLAEQYQAGQIQLSDLSGLARKVVEFLELLDPKMVVHRLTGEGPSNLMLAPAWGREKRRILAAIEQTLEEHDAWQGKRFAQRGRRNP